MNFSPRKLRTSMRVPLSDGTVDGEMRVHSAHFVQVALSDSLEHVGDVTADSPHCCQLLFLTKPLLNLDGVLIHHVDIDGQVLKALLQASPWPFDRHSP